MSQCLEELKTAQKYVTPLCGLRDHKFVTHSFLPCNIRQGRWSGRDIATKKFRKDSRHQVQKCVYRLDSKIGVSEFRQIA